MNNIQQELQKIEEYHQLGDFDVSIFMYKFFAVILGVSLFYKFVLNNLIENLGQDFYTLFFILSAFAFVIYQQIKIKKNINKQKILIFNQVNVYQFISDYLKHQGIEKNLDSVYYVVTGKILHKSLKQDKAEIGREKFQSIEDKSIEASSLEIVNYLKLI